MYIYNPSVLMARWEAETRESPGDPGAASPVYTVTRKCGSNKVEGKDKLQRCPLACMHALGTCTHTGTYRQGGFVMFFLNFQGFQMYVYTYYII